MLKSYLKIALRNLLRHKGYSFINIAGLAIGLVCCFLIVLFVRHELSYDRFHVNAPRLYRLLHAFAQNPSERSAISASGYAPHLLQEFPEIANTVRFFTTIGSANLKHGAEARTVTGFAFADSSVFNTFSFPLQRGNPAIALQAPNSLVLTAAAAQAWFGNEDPVGKIMTYLRGSQKLDLQITGILAEIPSHSHLQFDYLVSFATIKSFMGAEALEEYTNFNYYTYVLLRPGYSSEQLTDRFPAFLRKYRSEETANSTVLSLQPLTDIHLTTNIRWDLSSNISKRYVYIFPVVAVFILFIAAINFVNLATARAALRAKEVGLRKVVGAERRQLILQLFGESVFASLLALILALCLLQLTVPVLNAMLGRGLTLRIFDNPLLLLLLIGIGLATGVVAGVYPALVLSAYEPITVMKGLVTRGVQGARLRKVLIITQFGISAFLLIAVAAVYNQIQFMKTHVLGFDKEQVVFMNLSGTVKEHFQAFRANLLSHARVLEVTLGTIPGRVGTSRGYNWPGKEEEESRTFYTMFADAHTLATLGIELTQGRNFSEDIATDATHAYILNETAVRELGWQDPIAKPFRVWDEEMGHVVGVVKDFHFRSLHQKIEPLVLDVKPEWSWTVAVRVAPGDVRETLAYIAEQWRALEPDLPCDYQFLDADFDRLYSAEERLGRLFSSFGFLAIFISCLGLLGLAAFTAEQRTKEIGVRKVLGASVRDILLLLSKDFSKLVLVAFALATPFAFLAVNRWLQNFAYHTAPGVGTFALCGVLMLAIALITVSSQALRAALTDPAETLRYE